MNSQRTRLRSVVFAGLVLPAGQYALVTWGFNGTNQILNGSNDGPVFDLDTFSGKLQFDGSVYDDSAAVYPTTPDPSDHSIVPLYLAATLSPDAVSAIPEPPGVAIAFATAALARAGIVRRRTGRLARIDPDSGWPDLFRSERGTGVCFRGRV